MQKSFHSWPIFMSTIPKNMDEPQTSVSSWSISHEDFDHIDLEVDFAHFTKQLRRGGSQDPSSEDLAITGKVYTTCPCTLIDVLSWGYMG